MADSTTNTTGAIALPIFEASTDGGSVFNPIPELIQLDGENTTVENHETTNTDLTDNFKTFLHGWADGGEFPVSFNWREDTETQIKALLNLDIDFQISWTDAAFAATDPGVSFAGSISNFKINRPRDGAWTIDLTVKVSGAFTKIVGT